MQKVGIGQSEMGLADMGTVLVGKGKGADLVAVMKDGEVVETGPVARVFGHPQHAYTRALLASIPGRDFIAGRQAVSA